MPPSTDPNLRTSPPGPRALVSSILRQLSTLQPVSTSHSHPGTGLVGEAEHISDSEASDTSSSSSEAARPSTSGPSGTTSPSSNPLTPFLAHPHTKPLLATLHALFPHYLLPALDVLDRRLVTRLYTDAEQSVYYVRSLSGAGAGTGAGGGTKGTGTGSDVSTMYEVRLRPWHCTCAAYAFAAAEADAKAADTDAETGSHDGDRGYVFGGLYAAAAPPVCKHLLACLLADTWAPMRANVQERNVSVEELAGWAAGWV